MDSVNFIVNEQRFKLYCKTSFVKIRTVNSATNGCLLIIHVKIDKNASFIIVKSETYETDPCCEFLSLRYKPSRIICTNKNLTLISKFTVFLSILSTLFFNFWWLFKGLSVFCERQHFRTFSISVNHTLKRPVNFDHLTTCSIP